MSFKKNDQVLWVVKASGTWQGRDCVVLKKIRKGRVPKRLASGINLREHASARLSVAMKREGNMPDNHYLVSFTTSEGESALAVVREAHLRDPSSTEPILKKGKGPKFSAQ